MARFWLLAGLIAPGLLLLSVPAFAGDIPVVPVGNGATAPLDVQHCTLLPVGDEEYYAGWVVSVPTDGKAPIVAIRIVFVFGDAFGKIVDTENADWTADRPDYAKRPGDTLDLARSIATKPTWDFYALGDARRAACYLDKVMYADGSTWNRPQ